MSGNLNILISARPLLSRFDDIKGGVRSSGVQEEEERRKKKEESFSPMTTDN
ncbi:hypothetical protein [Dolichospermum sp. UHCC 0259]|uniref:hypothetical protein n=1 Tax=Dolichospermum sp. UHCC 0259 TaxID=2590010 RepID=UPI00144703BA|nr:hypothetical protein [Dolichospermum sp. UHCC 0259]